MLAFTSSLRSPREPSASLFRLLKSTALALIPVSCVAFSVAAVPMRADNSLTLELPPSAQAIAQRAAENAKRASDRIPEAPKPPQKTLQRPPIGTRRGSRTFLASRGQSGGDSERIVGRLGQVERSAGIYRTQTARSSRLSTAPAGTYLAIQAEAGNWYGILMSDGSIGWLRRESVHLLEYQVVSNGTLPQPQAPSGAWNGDYSDGLPSSKSVYFRSDPQSLFREAYRYLGVPYHFGGNSASGIDCSAFVKNVFQACGYSLPRHSSDQTAYGLAIPKEQLGPGDRLYFGNASTRNITHTGIYLGNGYFIHACSNSHSVAISQLTEPLYERMYICARR